VTSCPNSITGPFFANMGGFLMSLLLGFPGLRIDGPLEEWLRHEGADPRAGIGAAVGQAKEKIAGLTDQQASAVHPLEGKMIPDMGVEKLALGKSLPHLAVQVFGHLQISVTSAADKGHD